MALSLRQPAYHLGRCRQPVDVEDDPFEDWEGSTLPVDVFKDSSFVNDFESTFYRAAQRLFELWVQATHFPDRVKIGANALLLAEAVLSRLGELGLAPTDVSESADGGVALSTFETTSGGDVFAGIEILNEGVILVSGFQYGKEPTVAAFEPNIGGAMSAALSLFEVFSGLRSDASTSA